jgi:putative ATPase
MRPRNLDEYVGQEAILGPGRLLRRAIQADQLSSLIFYGPPGSGKTTLARVIANSTKSRFITLNAVLTGIADIRAAIEEAKNEKQYYGRRTIIFVDEVHRWNKAQQDALLPWVENGTFVLIGATTENPYFEVNRALVSRSRVFHLERLSNDDLLKAARAALSDKDRGYGRWEIEFEEGALEHLVDSANGDARSLLNALELAVETSSPSWPPEPSAKLRIGRREAEDSIQRKVVLYDKDGDYHYDVISAFIKSIRGSDPDASLYWLARMVAAGEDPSFIFRRMLISACEDVGLADPNAISVVEACAAAFERIGFPEGNFHLAHAALYLANCPKSNSALGFFDALESVKSEMGEVPNHLKDASRDGEDLGHGQGYLYPHAFRDHWTAQAYLPKSLKGRIFYQPSELGWEKEASRELVARRELQLAAYLETEASGKAGKPLPEIEWLRRSAERNGRNAIQDRDAVFAQAAIPRNARVLVLNAADGLMLWEALRLAPEGFVLGSCRSEDERAILAEYAEKIMSLYRPALIASPLEDPIALIQSARNACGFDPKGAFEFACGRNVQPDPRARLSLLAGIAPLLAPGGRLCLSEYLAGAGTRLSDFFPDDDPAFVSAFKEAEGSFYFELSGADSGDVSVPESLEAERDRLKKAGFDKIELKTEERLERRLLSADSLKAWFSPDSAFGRHVAERLGIQGREKAQGILSASLGQNAEREWKRVRLIIDARYRP